MENVDQKAERNHYDRDFALLFIANFLITATYLLLMTTMARYAIVTFGCSGSIAGLTASIFLIGGVLGRVLSGRYANRVGYKTMSAISAVVMLAICATYFITSTSLAVLMVARLIHGLTFGVAGTIMPSMAVMRLPKEHMGEGTGVFMLSTSIGMGVGPLGGLLVTAGFDYNVLFLAVSIMAAITLLCATLVKTGARDESLAAADRARPFTWRSFIDPDTLRISFFMFLVAFSYSTINAFLNSYAAELGLESFSPFAFLVYSVGTLVLRPLCGRIMDRCGENVVLYPSIASMAVGFFFCASIQGPVGMVLLGVFMATGFGTCMSTGQAVATKRVQASDTALAIGTFFIMCDAGNGLGAVFLGELIKPVGYRGMYLVAGAVCLIGLVYYWFAHGRFSARNSD